MQWTHNEEKIENHKTASIHTHSGALLQNNQTSERQSHTSSMYMHICVLKVYCFVIVFVFTSRFVNWCLIAALSSVFWLQVRVNDMLICSIFFGCCLLSCRLGIWHWNEFWAGWKNSGIRKVIALTCAVEWMDSKVTYVLPCIFLMRRHSDHRKHHAWRITPETRSKGPKWSGKKRVQ